MTTSSTNGFDSPQGNQTSQGNQPKAQLSEM
jgi:hypothetical protein